MPHEGGLAGHQAAVLGVEQEDQPHQHRDQPGVDLVRLVREDLPEQLALALVVGRLQAAEQLEQRRQHLLRQLG